MNKLEIIIEALKLKAIRNMFMLFLVWFALDLNSEIPFIIDFIYLGTGNIIQVILSFVIIITKYIIFLYIFLKLYENYKGL